MKGNDRERALDFEKIRRQKKLRRRRKIALIVAAALLALGIAVAVVAVQIAQVTDSGRDFWGNFNASHGLRSGETAE